MAKSTSDGSRLGPQHTFQFSEILAFLLAMIMITGADKIASMAGITIFAILANSFGKRQQVAWSRRIQSFGHGLRGDGQIEFATSSIMRCAVLSRRIVTMWRFTLPILLMFIAVFELGIFLAPERHKPEFTDLKIIFLLILVVCGARDFVWRRQLQVAFASLRSPAVPKS